MLTPRYELMLFPDASWEKSIHENNSALFFLSKGRNGEGEVNEL